MLEKSKIGLAGGEFITLDLCQMLIKMKFVTRTDPKVDLTQFKQDMLTSDRSKNDLRIPGVKSVKFREDTLKRL